MNDDLLGVTYPDDHSKTHRIYSVPAVIYIGTVYIWFFVGIDFKTNEVMAQVVLEQLRQEAERFIFLMLSPGGNDMAGITGYTVAPECYQHP